MDGVVACGWDMERKFYQINYYKYPQGIRAW